MYDDYTYEIGPVEGLGLSVPYVTSWNKSGEAEVSDAANCGSPFAVQQMLNDLGFGPLPVDGALGNKTFKALKDFAAGAGAPYDGTFPKGPVCSALVAAWEAKQAPAAPAPAPAPDAPTAPAPRGSKIVLSRARPLPLTRSGAGTGPTGGGVGGWWNAQTTLTKTAIVGGSALALVAVVALAMSGGRSKAEAATPNRRRGLVRRWDEPLPCRLCGGTARHEGPGHAYAPQLTARGYAKQACARCGGRGSHEGPGHAYEPPRMTPNRRRSRSAGIGTTTKQEQQAIRQWGWLRAAIRRHPNATEEERKTLVQLLHIEGFGGSKFSRGGTEPVWSSADVATKAVNDRLIWLREARTGRGDAASFHEARRRFGVNASAPRTRRLRRAMGATPVAAKRAARIRAARLRLRAAEAELSAAHDANRARVTQRQREALRERNAAARALELLVGPPRQREREEEG